MTTVDLVRAEIKSWERDFVARHGRDPSVQDIKNQPDIAEKYKLYKKLYKTLPKSRPVDPVPPLPGFNPFSPKKKTRTIKSTTPVARARKRLRGEPVSPSPSKPKRQRIHSQALPPFPNLDQVSSNSEDDADHELPHCDFTSSFVADSPVKAPAGGKSFKLLFDDALPALSIPKKPLGSPPLASSSRPSTDPPVTTSRKLHHDLTSKAVISAPVNRKMFPTKDHLPASAHKSTFPTVVSAISQPRTSVKRTLDTGEPVHDHTEFSTPSQPQYPLIPPSPPPQDSLNPNRDTGKAKAKAMASRKKSRVEKEESVEEVDSSDDITFKVATVCLDRDKRARRHVDDLDWDPLLHLATRNHDPAAEPQIDANHHASGTFTVNLPDKFRRVLAISPSRSQNTTEERVVRGVLYGDRVGHYNPSRGGDIWDAGETVDAAYGGDVETEDDWEAEPVPWEVGEL